ncbi:hypothetical protein ACFWZK_29085 [[Kitasatospora] papulosa]|uniref:hypothetical protein n=1 Tax=[Kitasatospora] papulosa TaxID=1464011 RepID=UPI0036C25359
MNASSSHSPLHKPEQGSAWTPPLDMALGLAREALVEQADANVYDKQAMIAAAVQLEIRLRGLVAALDKDKELAAQVAAHGPFSMPVGDTAQRHRQFTPLEEAVQGIETAIAPLKGDQRAGADMVLAYLRTLTTPDTTVPRDLRPGADAARRMIADREAAERAAVDRSITDLSPATAADRWNALYPVGTPVTAYPGCRPEDDPKCTQIVTRTRSAASVLGGHTAVVWVEGHSSCISLTHVDPRPETGGAQ